MHSGSPSAGNGIGVEDQGDATITQHGGGRDAGHRTEIALKAFDDDLALVLWLFKTLSDDLSDFSEWEKKTKTINIG